MTKIKKHWFKHDFFSSNDSKVQKLDFKYPVVGYGIFFKLLEMLYQDDGEIDYDLDFIAHCINYDKQVIESVINDFGLFVVEEQKLSNNRVTESINEILKKSELAKKSQSYRKY